MFTFRFSGHRVLLAGLISFGCSVSGEELLQTAETVPVKVPAWTNARASGVIPANWELNTVRDSEFSCSIATEQGKPVFLCNLKKGMVYFIIPAPEIKVAVPGEFHITMERPAAEWNNETILSVKGGNGAPSVWGGGFLRGIRLESRGKGVHTWRGTVNPPDWRKDSRYWLLLELTDPGLYRIYSVGTRVLPAGKPYYALRPEEKKSVNRIRNSRFPLGLPCGWSTGAVHRGSIRVSKEPGPSGERYLILETDVPETPLNSEAFNPVDFSKMNYVSVSYRAKGKWHARVYTGEGSSFRMKNVDLEPTEKWKRVMLAYRPCENARGHVLQIRGNGRLELDAVRACDTPDPEYRPQNRSEVALAVPESADAAESRILFDDEKPQIRYRLTGETDKVSIRFRAVNLYGESFALGSVTKPDGMVDFSAALKKRPFGQFRIEAVAEKDGVAVSPVHEIVVTRIPRPLFWGKDAPGSFFGVIAELDRSLLSMKAAGVNHVRFHDHGGLKFTGWFFTEPERGKWKFFDAEVERYRKLHLTIFGMLGTTPLWATNDPESKVLKSSYRTKWLIPVELRNFENYVAVITEHYRNSIREWGVGNEPWGGFFWEKFQDGKWVRGDQNHNFAEYQKAAYRAAKKVDPGLRLGGINATIRNGRWAAGLYRRGANAFCDVVELHLYSSAWNGFPGDTVERGVRTALGAIPWGKPLWNTEGQGCASGNLGYPEHPQIGLNLHSIAWINQFDYVRDADKQVRYLVSCLANGMERVYLYSGKPWKYVGVMEPAAFSVLEQTDGFPSPQLVAFSALARRVDGRSFREVFPLAPDVWCYLFESDGGSTAVVIPKRFSKSVSVSCSLENVAAFDLFGNPIVLPALSGEHVWYLQAPVSSAVLKKALVR